MWAVEALPFSLLGQLKAMHSLVSEEGTDEWVEDLAVLYSLFVAFLVIVTGMFLEFWIGPLLVGLPDTNSLWKFAQIFMVCMVFASFASGSFACIRMSACRALAHTHPPSDSVGLQPGQFQLVS